MGGCVFGVCFHKGGRRKEGRMDGGGTTQAFNLVRNEKYKVD
jgi:hypothetical protein